MTIIKSALTAALLSLGSIATAAEAPALAPEIFASCDVARVRQAAGQLLDDPQTLQQPVVLFLAAQGLRVNGDREQAAFFYLLARLRATRQAMVDQGDAAQLVDVMSMTVGPLIMPDLSADPAFASAAIARTLAWDKARPDNFRERALAQGGKAAADIAALEASFRRLPDDIRAKVSPEEAVAAQKRAEKQIGAMKAAQCRPDTVDASNAAAAVDRIREDALRMVATHPLVLRRAGGAVRSMSVAAMSHRQNALPDRLTVTVDGAAGARFYAEVNVATSVSAERKLTSVTASLACVTGQWLGQRDAVKDVCTSDPAAERPADRPAGAEAGQPKQ